LIDNLHKQVPGIIKLPTKTNLYSGSSGVVSLLQTQSSELKEEDKLVLELIQRVGYDKAKDLLTTQVHAMKEEDWEQNFD